MQTARPRFTRSCFLRFALFKPQCATPRLEAASWPCRQLTEPALYHPTAAFTLLAPAGRCDSVHPRLFYCSSDNLHYVIGCKGPRPLFKRSRLLLSHIMQGDYQTRFLFLTPGHPSPEWQIKNPYQPHRLIEVQISTKLNCLLCYS